MTKAAMTPGTQPQSHNKKTINTEPHPLSKTAKGGHKIESSTRQKLIKQNAYLNKAQKYDAITCLMLHYYS